MHEKDAKILSLLANDKNAWRVGDARSHIERIRATSLQLASTWKWTWSWSELFHDDLDLGSVFSMLG